MIAAMSQRANKADLGGNAMSVHDISQLGWTLRVVLILRKQMNDVFKYIFD
jgi:hypothetical protein